MIFWADRLIWSSGCLLAGLLGLEHIVQDYIEYGWASPTIWLRATGMIGMLVGLIRAWVVR